MMTHLRTKPVRHFLRPGLIGLVILSAGCAEESPPTTPSAAQSQTVNAGKNAAASSKPSKKKPKFKTESRRERDANRKQGTA